MVIAHRTCPRDAPENSLAGIAAARRLGADAVEIDVQLTSDGHPILMHDTDLRRTTGHRGAVADTSFADIRRLRLRRGDEVVPTFAEALDAVGDDLRVAIDLKEGDAADAVVTEILGQGAQERVLVWAKQTDALRLSKQRAPGIETALLRDAKHPGAITRFLDDAVDCGADAISAHWWSVGERFARRVRERDLILYAWCKSPRISRSTMARLDGIVTDWPRYASCAISNHTTVERGRG